MTATTPSRPARLTLTRRRPLPGLLDGAWWPFSRDLATELPALVDAMEERCGPVTRITVGPARWHRGPREIIAMGHTVHLAWFTGQDPDLIVLRSYGLGRCDLLVVPPETAAASADLMMASVPGTEITDRHGTRGTAAQEGLKPSAPLSPVVGARVLPLPRSMWR
ncbi:DUF5994 family protein [Streptomyces xanthii]|uniref:Uncharacterized protein n=1 Tax=Streptomyces xanthii TaxID=2768069 RepID=A0A7H1B9T2_9ACTN|nr:DUF5994 family protein [Streptomyces xanthii]QNS05487.1 hypothetical protein IAG42_19070 [Streptomyces xanthii]